MKLHSLLSVVALLITMGWLMAAAAQDDSGGVIINSASIEIQETSVRVDVDADFLLPLEVKEGLNSGVPLEFVVEVKLQRPRRWLPDANLAVFERRYSLVYYELTRHYRVRTLDTNTSRNFRSLLPALAELGALRDVMIPINAETAEELGRAKQASVQIKLNEAALPLPLQPVFSSPWRLGSKEYQWQLD